MHLDAAHSVPVRQPSKDAPGVISEAGRKYLRLQSIPDVGPIRARNLLSHFGSIDAIFDATAAELERVEQVGRKVSESILRYRSDEIALREIERASDCGVRILCQADLEYPPSLLQIPDPPICLYIRGTLLPTDAVAIAIVGTRDCTHYGREQSLRFSERLATCGFTIVSGLARGIDGDAHCGALRGGGRTLAVLGNGLAHVYPAEHSELSNRVADSGAVISELPMDCGPEAKNFPGRNRIIVGLSLGVIVIEAGLRSGAMITARLANEYNREVFAVPGRVDQPEKTNGVNQLIRDGAAKLITCVDDVLEELGDVGKIMANTKPADPRKSALSFSTNAGDHPSVGPAALAQVNDARLQALSPVERAVLGAVRNGIEDLDSIGVSLNVGIADIGAALTALELRGMVRRYPGPRFTLR